MKVASGSTVMSPCQQPLLQQKEQLGLVIEVKCSTPIAARIYPLASIPGLAPNISHFLSRGRAWEGGCSDTTQTLGSLRSYSLTSVVLTHTVNADVQSVEHTDFENSQA